MGQCFGKKQQRTMSKRKLIDTPTLEELECPVCLEVPRTSPIYNCLNGHLLCSECQPKMQRCPICRCENINNKNHLAERLVNRLAEEGRKENCRNTRSGCSVTDFVQKLTEHEQICVYRQVSCPAHIRGACTWKGPLSAMLLHTIDAKCAQIVKSRVDNEPFSSVIGDFSNNDTVFGRILMTHWKPVLLISRQIIRLFAHLVMYRDPLGNWIFYVKSFATNEALQRIQCTIEVTKAKQETEQKENENVPSNNTKEEEKSDIIHHFTGDVHSSALTEQQVIDTGSYMVLKDSQIRRCQYDRTLLRYRVKIFEKVPKVPNSQG